MKLEISFIDDTWARVRFIGDTDYLLGVLAPSRDGSLPQIVKAGKLAGWDIVYPGGGEDNALEEAVKRLYDIIERDFPNNYRPIADGAYGYVIRAVREAINE